MKVPVSVHDLVFNSTVDDVTRHRALPLSNTLVLAGFNIYEGLKIDDPDKVRARDFVFRARGRDLKGAIFDLANLPKVDFEGAELQGASLIDAQLEGASLSKAQLQGAFLNHAQLQGAVLDDAQLQGATLAFAYLQGASLNRARLLGASLRFARLQGTSLISAQLQGAHFLKARLEASDLSGAYLWRAHEAPSKVAALRLHDLPNTWGPMSHNDVDNASSDDDPWNEKAYEELVKTMMSPFGCPARSGYRSHPDA